MDNENVPEKVFHDDKVSVKFQTGEFLYSVIQKEYEYEANRLTNLQSRTGVLLTFDIAYLAFLSTSAKIPKVYEVKVSSVLESFPYFISILFYFATFVLVLISISYFLKVFSIETYGRLPLKDFNREHALLPKDIIAVAIMENYRKIVEQNSQVIDKKFDYYKIGIYTIIISLLCNCIIFLVSLFL